MSRYLFIIISYLLFEISLYLIFSILNAHYLPNSEGYNKYENLNFKDAFKKDVKAFTSDNVKGIIERIFLILGIGNGLGQVIIAFSAIKLGTRINNSCKVTQDYFVIGNLISLISSIIFSIWLIPQR